MGNKTASRLSIFVKEYRKDRNGTRAAIAAGFAAKSAHVTASRLLRNAKVKAQIDKEDTELANRLDLSVEWVIKRLMYRAGFDVRKFYREDGSLIPVKELDDETAYALQGLEIEKLYEHFGKGQAQDTGTLTKIKFADRDRALELLGRHLKMFTEKIEVSGLDQIADAVARARQRAASR